MEHWILVAMWIFGLIGFIWLIPRQHRREGFLSSLTFQAFIWLCDMPSFTYGLLSAPVREFPKASELTITINYFFYPVLFAIFYVHRKVNRKLRFRLAYFFVWTSAITLYDVIIEKYTDLLEYEILTWFGMWIYINFLFYISLICCNWFLKEKFSFESSFGEKNEN